MTEEKNEKQKIKLEIDYDKLAQAIVKANRLAEKTEHEQAEGERKGNAFARFWKNVGKLLTGKYKVEGEHWITVVFSVILSAIFFVVGWLGFICSISMFGYFFYYAIKVLTWTGAEVIAQNIFSLMLELVIIFLTFLISLMMIGAGREAQKSKDKNFIVGAFSGMVSLVALIVSLIALVK